MRSERERKHFKVVVKQEIKKVLARKENAFPLLIERLNLVVLYHITRLFWPPKFTVQRRTNLPAFV